eukprot:TRINITY_DN22841_c0_g1_i1.p1 TRINITY_DN22841_c0_g1~~TRINITY_DN22841_c0_g1_i1.p1  ORF type:complete len:608 (+),score=135.04 TRINITY_DN22841_c0_g1_i1:133-1824(+)
MLFAPPSTHPGVVPRYHDATRPRGMGENPEGLAVHEQVHRGRLVQLEKDERRSTASLAAEDWETIHLAASKAALLRSGALPLSPGAEAQGCDGHWELLPLDPLMLAGDTLTAAAVRDGRFVATGTQKGRVFIFSLSGDPIVRRESHNSAVLDVSLDAAGDTIASAGRDGRVVVFSLYDAAAADASSPEAQHPQQQQEVHEFSQAVRCVCVEPNYATAGGGRRLVCADADGTVTLVSARRGISRLLGAAERRVLLRAAAVDAVRWCPDGSSVAVLADDGVHLCGIAAQWSCFLRLESLYVAPQTLTPPTAPLDPRRTPPQGPLDRRVPTGSSAAPSDDATPSPPPGASLARGAGPARGGLCWDGSGALFAARGGSVVSLSCLPRPSHELCKGSAPVALEQVDEMWFRGGLLCGAARCAAGLAALVRPRTALPPVAVAGARRPRYAAPELWLLSRAGDGTLDQEVVYQLPAPQRGSYSADCALVADWSGGQGAPDEWPVFVLSPQEVRAVVPRSSSQHLQEMARKGTQAQALLERVESARRDIAERTGLAELAQLAEAAREGPGL